MQTAYVLYDDNAKIDYAILLRLYLLAKYDSDTKLYSIITYKSQETLAELLNISPSTLKRFLNSNGLQNYLTIDKKKREIKLLNNFIGVRGISYVTLSEREVNYLIDGKELLFIKYYLYLKYYCGKSRLKAIDTTAKQFLSAIGYSDSGKTLSKLSSFNNTLVQDGFITIERFTDTNGYLRNRYRIK